VAPPRVRPWLVVAGFVVAGGAYGWATSRIPSPHDPSAFWIGNLCAPWLVLSFLAGRAQTSRWIAVLAGALTDVACVAGFYLTFLTLGPVTIASFGDWLRFSEQWLVAAVLGGAVYGALGNHWRRSHVLVAGLAVALPFAAEPVLWPLYDGRYRGPWFVWAGEAAAGLALGALVLGAARRQGVRADRPA
jgi:uncharacterized protein DUF6518